MQVNCAIFCNVNMNFVLLFVLQSYVNPWKQFYPYSIASPSLPFLFPNLKLLFC